MNKLPDMAGSLKSLSTEDVDRIALLAEVSEVLNSDASTETMLLKLVEVLCSAMGAQRGFIELFSDGGKVHFARDYSSQEPATSFPFSQSLVQNCVENEKPLVVIEGQQAVATESMVVHGIRSVLIHPLKGHKALRGVVYLDSLITAGAFTENDLGMLGVFANMVGVALERHDKHMALQKAQRSLADAAHGTIVRLSQVAEFRDSEGGAHLDRVSLYSELLGRKLGFAEVHVARLKTASMMHDIGKLGIPDSILLKPGRFSDFERQIMQEHTTIGAQILGGSDSDVLRLGEQIALTHHEKWDGTGYPRGLKGESIPLAGRLVALADVFDAITSKRRYKSAYPLESAFKLVEEEAGSHFDPKLAKVFLEAKAEVEKIFWDNPDPTTETPQVTTTTTDEEPTESSLETNKLSGASILLVDPDRYLGEALVTEATRRHTTMAHAIDVEQAKVMIAELRPKVMVLEVTLPGAVELMDWSLMREDGLDIIVLSRDDSFTRRVEVSRRGVRTYLQKPVPAKSVLDRASKSLGVLGADTPRVLVLDDDPVQLKVISGIMKRKDYEVTCISDPLELWDKLPEINPDLLILDLEMPRISGFEICKVLRAAGRWTHLPVVVVTGHKDALTYSRALEAGADDVLAKPLKPRTLMSRLDTRIRRTRAIRRGASYEPVTGLVALQHAQESGHLLTSLAVRLKSTITVGLLRLVGFEELKSQVGRATVDRMQREAAALLTKGLRSEDILSRFEDGCFLVAMPGSDKQHCQVVLESLNQRLAKLEFDEGSVQVDWELVSSPEDGTGINELIAKLTKS